MRLSVKQQTRKTLSSILHPWVIVRLNGIEQKAVVVADDKLGFVERVVPSFARRGTGVATETVFGVVEIELKADAPAAVQKVWKVLRKGKETVSFEVGALINNILKGEWQEHE